jgi:uncharacterized protein (TIGR02145 family)
MKKKITIAFLTFFLISFYACKKDDVKPNRTGTMTDQEGNVYKTITIGKQTWMAENLRTTTFRNGSAIRGVTDKSEWLKEATAAYCNYNNTTSADTIEVYGRLYNWYAASDPSNIAPIGWHVPTDADWTILTEHLGAAAEIGGKLKAKGTQFWKSPNTGAIDEVGFTALPGGYCRGGFVDFGMRGLWWSSTSADVSEAFYRRLYFENTEFWRADFDKLTGFSIRCVKD